MTSATARHLQAVPVNPLRSTEIRSNTTSVYVNAALPHRLAKETTSPEHRPVSGGAIPSDTVALPAPEVLPSASNDSHEDLERALVPLGIQFFGKETTDAKFILEPDRASDPLP